MRRLIAETIRAITLSLEMDDSSKCLMQDGRLLVPLLIMTPPRTSLPSPTIRIRLKNSPLLKSHLRKSPGATP